MPLDYEARYGLRPLLLESFVDTSLFKGTCYKAANWELVGQTKERGRQDSKNEYKETIKDIYVFPLDIDFRTKMGGGAFQKRGQNFSYTLSLEKL